MLPIKFIRENPDSVRDAIRRRGASVELDRILELDGQVRALLHRVEGLKAERNRASEEVGGLKKRGEDATDLITRMKSVSAEIREQEETLGRVQGDLEALLDWVPNLPHGSTPEGSTPAQNLEVRRWGKIPEFPFIPKDHVSLASALGLLDLERGSRMSGSGFPLYTGQGARLERALINFMIDHHSRRGYAEIYPPFAVLPESVRATGQLPKLAEDMYRLEKDDLYLIPTAEVPVTNIHREEILAYNRLPIRYVAFSPCFRREAGSYGRETRGLLRVHQFNKVELVKFTEPERSYAEHESLTADAESILQALEIPYRVVALCAGDLGFAAAKCYDLEVWAPAEGRWLEVSSCSNFESFQARRASIRYRRPDGTVDYVHTLNGSGVATPRLFIALLENHQTEEGSVMIPEALHSYLGESLLRPAR